MIQYHMYEIEIQEMPPEVSQVEVMLYGEFTCGETTITVPGFYAGNGIYKIRFLPQNTGLYRWKIKGIFEGEGQEECFSSGDEIHHGLARADGTSIRFEDGELYRPFGTTVYGLIHQKKDLIVQTIDSILHSPFDKVRICLFPKSYVYNLNEPDEFPFVKNELGEFDYEYPYFPFWEKLEKIIAFFEEHKIQVDLILFHPYDRWGFSKMNRHQYTLYLNYLLRRLAAFPNVWWSLANEYDSMDCFDDGDWEAIEKQLDNLDPYGHMRSCHFMLQPYNYSKPGITHCSAQGDDVSNVMELRNKYHKPVIYDEFGYEGNLRFPWGNLSAYEMVYRYWQICTRGGYASHGETFWNPEETLWWSKGGTLIGKSPARIGFLKEILNSLPEALEPIDTRYMTPQILEEIRQGLHPEMVTDYTKALLRIHVKKAYQIIEQNEKYAAIYAGHCGEDAYLFYYGRRCTREADILLPQTATYVIYIIDTWEMTKTENMLNASGQIKVILPGKEYIAVLAVKQ